MSLISAGSFGIMLKRGSGPSLLGYLDDMEIMDRNIDAPFMLPISEKYNEMGTMVMGKIESGRVKRGDSLMLMPNKASTITRAMDTYLH